MKGKETAISYARMYPVANLYDYKNNAKQRDSLVVRPYGYETYEEALVRKHASLLQSNTDSVVNKIVLRARLIIDVGNVRHVMIKYKLDRGGVVSNEFLVTDLVQESGRWTEYTAENEEIRLLRSLVQIASVDLFFLFNSERDTPKAPEVTKLRASVRNNAGLVDIALLERIIRENKVPLEKYQD